LIVVGVTPWSDAAFFPPSTPVVGDEVLPPVVGEEVLPPAPDVGVPAVVVPEAPPPELLLHEAAASSKPTAIAAVPLIRISSP
jgi:hypothetical protein